MATPQIRWQGLDRFAHDQERPGDDRAGIVVEVLMCAGANVTNAPLDALERDGDVVEPFGHRANHRAASSKDPNGIALEVGAERRPQRTALAEVDATPQPLLEVLGDRGLRHEREPAVRRDVDHQIDVAVDPGIAAGHGAEQLEMIDPAPAQLWRVRAQLYPDLRELGRFRLLARQQLFDRSAHQLLQADAEPGSDRREPAAQVGRDTNRQEHGVAHVHK